VVRCVALLLALACVAAGEEKDLAQPPASSKARQLREQAQDLWNGVQPVWEKVRYKKEVSPEEATTTLPVLEQVVDLFERSLEEEWNGEANKQLVDAAKAWYGLLPLIPPPEPPVDEALRKKAEKEARAEQVARIRAVRDFVMKWGRERRADSILRTCTKCDGRKELRSPFGDKAPCPACGKRGRLVNRDAVIAAHWNRYSPLYRSVGRHEAELNKLLRSLAPDEQRDLFAPYIVSVSIKDVEDNDTWARVTARDVVQPSSLSPKTEKVDTTYVLFRVGKVWYVYDPESDQPLLDLREKLAPPPEK